MDTESHLIALAHRADALTAAHSARDQAILDAAAAGVQGTAIADAVGLSRMQVHRIVKSANAPGDPVEA